MQDSAQRRTRWLAEGLESLICKQALGRTEPFDVLIVGSGYGGAIAAGRLAGLHHQGRPLKVALLERGVEYLPGSFPNRAAELPGHVRFTTPEGKGANGRLEGLFDMRLGKDVSVLVANGLGGGSLINAGVLAFPDAAVLGEAAWPAALRGSHASLSERAVALQKRLGANNGVDAVRPPLARSTALRSMGAFAPVPVSIALNDGLVSSAGVALNKCTACGDCATGCNEGAKDSLDVNLLRQAQVQGAELYVGATVSRVWRSFGADPLWEVGVWHTDAKLRQRMAQPLVLQARRVILAAGALGSTEILLRSQTTQLQFSTQLGRCFSANGDILATLVSEAQTFNAVADENQDPAARNTGPTITAMLDQRAGNSGYVVQDLGVPGALSRLFEEASTTAAMFQGLDQADQTQHLAWNAPDAQSQADPCAVNPATVSRSLAVAIMARDGAAGVMSAAPDDVEFPQDAGLRIDWPGLRNEPGILSAHENLAAQLSQHRASLLANPMWRLLPPELERMLGARRGPMLTVHPLGGCRMADSVAGGVVNHLGQVFDAATPQRLHQGLVVLDGAIVPCSLGINPALTIATLADVAVDGLIKAWDLAAPHDFPVPHAVARPRFRRRGMPTKPVTTKVQVIERLTGPIDIHGLGSCWMEIDLVYENRELFPVDEHGRRKGYTQQGHVLGVAPNHQLSRVRLFAQPGSMYEDDRSDDDALFIATVKSGSTLRFLHREPSTWPERRCRAWWAWLKNRGLRDAIQMLVDGLLGSGTRHLTLVERWRDAMQRYRQSLNLASRAGEVRLFDYSLQLDPTYASDDLPKALHPEGVKPLELKGRKRITYERRSNPWAQLMRMELTSFGGLTLGERCHLTVSPAYFALKHMPLLRLVDQQDQPSALIDLMAFGLYLARVFVGIHLWSGRKPDQALCRRRNPRRLPGPLSGMTAPEVHEFIPDGAQGEAIRLTRYPAKNARDLQPVLLIHGYSASGTTFAHPALNPSLALHLWRHGYEPWIVDLRSSCGMPTATRPYAFEDIAEVDIPAAVREVCARTGKDKIDIVSHCMGSAMLAMTLQSTKPCAATTAAHMRSWVMSQFGPRMRFSPGNVLRAYLMSWFRHLLPNFHYSLSPGTSAAGVDGDMYDRLLATLPYLNDEMGSEFDVENPSWLTPWKRRPWVGTRHRLDALIGRTFDARAMSLRTLDHIDDFFGPVNLTTLSQPIYFALTGEATDQNGATVFGAESAPMLKQVPMLSLHGATNGLASPDTADLLQIWAADNQLDLQHKPFPQHGHQDLLIGKDTADVFRKVTDFLDAGKGSA